MTLSFEKDKLDCKDFYGYLHTLPGNILDNLYDHPNTCLAVFRGLPELGKHYVMRTLFMQQSLPESFLSTWTQKDGNSLHDVAVMKLKGLQIWKEISMGSSKRYEMNSNFRKNLQIGICGGIDTDAEPTKSVEEKHVKDIEFLDRYSKERWESVLYYMTGSSATDTAGISGDVAKILINAGLLTYDSEESSTSITSSGFQFLLMDTSSQVWYFMIQYLETLRSTPENLIQCLSFLFQISYSVLGKDYPVRNLKEVQYDFLQHLREVGLAFQRKRKSKRFYPTRLAINLGSAVTSNVSEPSHKVGFLVVETNYRIYAYTDSALEIALLSLFTEIKTRFPQFAVGILSRQSVQQALACGISAEQIISFLQMRAHPQMQLATPILPATITDQVKLWEMERDRLRYTEGVLYNQFLSQSDFEMLKKYAESINVLLWANTMKRLMVVSKAGHDNVKKHWKRNKSP